jgi:hypothetical protein
MFITASKDNTSRLFDATELTPLKIYKTERPVNSAALSPIMDHVIQKTKILSMIYQPLPLGGTWRWSGGHGGDNDVNEDRQVRLPLLPPGV